MKDLRIIRHSMGILSTCRFTVFKSVLMCTVGTDGVSQKGRKMKRPNYRN
jgi:hypothetical protein